MPGRSRHFVCASALAFVMGLPSLAQALSLTYNGSILQPDGTPVSGSVAFNIAVKSSAGCVIYRETQTTTVTSGAFALSLNSGSSTVVHGSSAVFDSAFTNAGTFSCEGGGTFTPTANATRVLGVTFTPPSAAAQTLADQAINAVPTASEAMNAAAVGGFPTSALLRVAAGTTPGTASALTAAQFTELLSLAGGTSTQYVRSSTTIGAPAPPVSTGTGAPGSAIAGSIWFNTSTNRLMYYDGSQAVTLSGSTSASGVTSVTAGTGIATTGTSGAITLSLATSGVTAGSYTKLTVDTYGRATSGSTLTQTDLPTITTAGKVSGAAITSGTIGGTTSLVTSGTVTAGTVSAYLVAGTAMSTRQIAVYNPAGTFATTLSSSTLLASNLSFNLPSTAGTANQVLATDGAGNLSWATSSGGGSSQWTTSGTNIYYNSGNVGIGTTSPGTNRLAVEGGNLVVIGSDATRAVGVYNFDSTADRFPAFEIYNVMGTGLAGYPIFQATNLRGTSSATTAVQAGDTLVSFQGLGSTGPSFAAGPAAAIQMYATQNFAPSNLGGAIRFQTTTNGAAFLSTKMTIGNDGNVGIGTTVPAIALDIVGQAAGIRGTGTTPGELRLGPGPSTGTNYVGFRAPASNPASNVVWTLPAADGTANQVLLTNGAGTLSWATQTGGGGGIGSINGLSASAQALLTPTTTGTLMSWTSSGTTHTLNLPVSSGTTPFGLLTSADWTSFNSKISGVSGSTLTSGNIWVGSAGNVAASVAMSGDATLSNTGVLAISAGSVTGTELATAAANATTKILSASPGAGYLLSTDIVTGSTIAALGTGCIAGQTIVWSASGFACAPSHTFGTGTHIIARQSAAASGGALLTLTSNNATNSVSFRAPDSLASSLTWVLPSTAGTANQVLSNDGSGNLTWATVSGGSGSSQWISAGTNIGYTAGYVGIGTTVPGYPLEVSQSSTANSGNQFAQRTYLSVAPSSASTANSRGHVVGVSYNSSQNNTSTVLGVSVDATHDGTSGTLTSLAGFNSYVANNNGGSVSSAIGINSSVFLATGSTGNLLNASGGVFGVNRNATGTMNNATGIEAYVTNTASGAITAAYGLTTGISSTSTLPTNSYGIHIGTIAGTNKWSLFASDTAAPSFFAGKVGIGTSSPYEMLTVEQADSTSRVAVINSNSTSSRYPGFSATNYMGSAGSGFPAVDFFNFRGTIAAPSAVQAGDKLGGVNGYGANGVAYGLNQSSAISLLATQAYTASNAGGAISFSTAANNTTSLLERMRIEQNGNVGIGTTGPVVALDVSGTARVNAYIENPTAFTDTSTAYTIPDTTRSTVRLTLTGNATVTLPAYTTPSSTMYALTVIVRQDGTGNRTLAWAVPGGDSLLWDSSASAPAPATGATKTTIYQFFKFADDTQWYGSQIWMQN